MIAFISLWMTFFGRMSGGGLYAGSFRDKMTSEFGEFWGSLAGRFPEMMFALPIALVSTAFFQHYFPELSSWALAWFVVMWNISYWSMEMGHGTVMGMKGYQQDLNEPDRLDGVERLVRRFYKKYKNEDITRDSYSWWTMGFKGFCIMIPLLPLAPLNAILWPTGYHLGNVEEKEHIAAELLSCLFAATLVALALEWLLYF